MCLQAEGGEQQVWSASGIEQCVVWLNMPHADSCCISRTEKELREWEASFYVHAALLRHFTCWSLFLTQLQVLLAFQTHTIREGIFHAVHHRDKSDQSALHPSYRLPEHSSVSPQQWNIYFSSTRPSFSKIQLTSQQSISALFIETEKDTKLWKIYKALEKK